MGLGRQGVAGVLFATSAMLGVDAATDSGASERGQWTQAETTVDARDIALKATGAAVTGVAGAGMLVLGGLGAGRVGQHEFGFEQSFVLRPYLRTQDEQSLEGALWALDGQPDRVLEWLQMNWQDHPYLTVTVHSCKLSAEAHASSVSRRVSATARVRAQIQVREREADHSTGQAVAKWMRDRIIDELQDLLEDKILHTILIRLETNRSWEEAGKLALTEQMDDLKRRLAGVRNDRADDRAL